MLHEVARPERSQLLAAERNEHDGPRGVPAREQPGDLEQRGGAGGVVVGAVVHAAGRVGVHGAEAAEAQVVVVRPDHHDFAAQRGRRAGQDRHHVAGGRASQRCVQHRRGVGRNREVLERRLEAGAREAVPDVGAGAAQAGGSHAAAFLPVVGEEAHVREHTMRDG